MTQLNKKYTVLSLVRLMSDFLQEKGIENARLNAELLAGKVFNLSRVELYLNFERPVSPRERNQLRELLRRRANNEPLQYLLGETEFYSLPFNVTPKTLIPRPETEILVEFIIKNYQQFFADTNPLHILDIGTGSGNIAITLAKHIPEAEITAIDVDSDTLSVAKKNAEKNGVAEKVEFLQLDIFSEIPGNFKQFQIIAANLPYISADEMKNLPREVRDFEPKVALYGGEDGLDYFRKLYQILDKILAPDGMIVLEIGENQGKQVRKIFSANDRIEKSELIADLNQKPRVFWAKFC